LADHTTGFVAPASVWDSAMRYRKLVILCLLSIDGCIRPRLGFLIPEPDGPVWPVPPEPARVRFVGTIQCDLSAASSSPMRGSFQETMQSLLWGPSPSRRLLTPHAIAVHPDQRRVAIADTNASRVHVIDLPSTKYEEAAPVDEDGAILKTPVGVVWVGDQLWIADAGVGAIVKMETASSKSGVLIGKDKLVRPAGVAHDSARQRLYVSDAGAHRIVAFDLEGSELYRFGTQGAAPGELNFPAQLSCDPDGNIVVADALNFRVQRFSPEGRPLGYFGKKGDAAGDFALPKGVATDSLGNIWVVDSQFENVQAFDREGRLLLALGGEGQRAGEFWLPAGATVDRENRLWIADTYNRRVQVFQILP